MLFLIFMEHIALVLTITGSFGTVALLLQLVPVLSMCFLMTTAAGAALWAVDIERKRSLLETDREAGDRDSGYHDDQTM